MGGLLLPDGIFLTNGIVVKIEEVIREVVEEVLLLDMVILIIKLGARGEWVEGRGHSEQNR
jgi:hypothetical protein